MLYIIHRRAHEFKKQQKLEGDERLAGVMMSLYCTYSYLIYFEGEWCKKKAWIRWWRVLVLFEIHDHQVQSATDEALSVSKMNRHLTTQYHIFESTPTDLEWQYLIARIKELVWWTAKNWIRWHTSYFPTETIPSSGTLTPPSPST